MTISSAKSQSLFQRLGWGLVSVFGVGLGLQLGFENVAWASCGPRSTTACCAKLTQCPAGFVNDAVPQKCPDGVEYWCRPLGGANPALIPQLAGPGAVAGSNPADFGKDQRERVNRDQGAAGGTGEADKKKEGEAFKPSVTSKDYSYSKHASADQYCGVSATIDKQYGCGTTMATVQGAQVSNMLTQTVGSTVAMTMGQQAQASALQSGTQESALRGAGETQVKTGQIQQGMGAINAAMGALQLYQSMKHSKNSREIESAKAGDISATKLQEGGMNGASDDITDASVAGHLSSKNAVGNKIIDKFNLNREGTVEMTKVRTEYATATSPEGQQVYQQSLEQRKAEIKKHEQNARSEVGQIVNRGSAEQAYISQNALGGGMMSLITGSQQLMSGTFSVSAGNRLIATADKLKFPQKGSTPVPVVAPGIPTNVAAGSSVTRAPTQILGKGNDEDANAATEEEQKADEDTGDLGLGFGPNALPSGLPNGLPPGKFNAGSNPPGQGGGGGGLGPGASTNPGAAAQEDPQPKLAPAAADARYEGGGAGPIAGGGGGGGSKGGDSGMDIGAILAKFLPQKEEEKQNPRGILEYGSNAPEKPDGSILGPQGNIFDRVKGAYILKQKQKEIGIVGS